MIRDMVLPTRAGIVISQVPSVRNPYFGVNFTSLPVKIREFLHQFEPNPVKPVDESQHCWGAHRYVDRPLSNWLRYDVTPQISLLLLVGLVTVVSYTGGP